MRINEVESQNNEELLALAQFLMSRADDKDAQKKISVQAFLKLASNMGISLGREQLINLIQQPPLSNIIQGIDGEEIRFKGNEGPPDETMSVDQAERVVNQMATRAAKKGL